MRQVYLDYAATTPLHPEIETQMQPFYTEQFGNASSTHRYGRHARIAVEQTRETLAEELGCDPKELIFTSGGTEADNAALLGSLAASQGKSRHVVTSSIEHHAIISTCEFLEKMGVEVTYVKPDESGHIRPEDFQAALREDTVIATCMWVNNETGAIQPVEQMAAICQASGVPFHTDAVQAAGVLDISLKDSAIALLSLSSHKIYGPKGIGALFIRADVPFHPVLHGGSQERGRRAGTENVPAIVGFGHAFTRSQRNLVEHTSRLQQLKNLFLKLLRAETDEWILLSKEPCVPSILLLGFPGIKSELILMNLDLQGIAASSGSACTAGSIQPSHVLLEMGLDILIVRSAIRFSFSHETTEEDIAYTTQVLGMILKRLRKSLP